MALVLNDRVKETTTTTGTGTINLAGAETGFETFVQGIGNSNTTYYAIVHQSLDEFEVGLGTVTDASPDTLSRTTIISSTNSDSAVDFSAGTKNVFCTLPASKAIVEDGSGNLEIDISGIIVLDADNAGVVQLKDGGSHYGSFYTSSDTLNIQSNINNADMNFIGKDDNTNITALTFDMSDAGKATFNDGVKADYFKATGSIPSETSASTAYLDFASGNARIVTKGADGSTQGGFQILQQASDGSPNNTPLHISSDGKIGIGTTDPDTDGYSYAEDFVVKAGVSADDGVGITLQSNTRRYGVLAFGDSADTNAGELWYDHTLNSLNMRTSGVSRILLDSSGNATFTGNVTAYGSVSDERLKENIKVIENPIEKIKDLKGVTFTYKKDGEKSTGLIAQDLEKVLPEAVYTSETIADEREGDESEEHLAIRYGNTVGLLVEAIKEQQKEIDTLNDYVKLQSATIMDMERRLNELEDK